MLKRICSAAVSILLALAVCFTTCTGALAASSQQRYISDIVVCSASGSAEAEKELKAQGYKLLSPENLNEALPKGMYIGYKTTSDPDEAITDIAAMNMKGNYSFTDYETLLNKMKEDVASTIDGLIPMINAFRVNFKAGRPIAVEVYEILNKFIEDDSAKLMGDYLLTCDLADTADITKVFMQAYSPFIVDIQQLLFIAGESDADRSWIEKMAASDPELLIDMYLGSYPTANRAFSALVADYGDAADDISLTWDAFCETLKKAADAYFIEENGIVSPDEEAFDKDIATLDENAGMYDDETEESLEKFSDSAIIFDAILDASLVSYLYGLEYNGGTMLDFFMRPLSEVDDTELYTLAYFMGTSLTSQVSNVGLTQTVSRVMVDGDTASSDRFKEINNAFSKIEKISIYDGVDRSLFENGVALTGPTVSKFTSSGKNWSDDLFSRLFSPTEEYKWTDYLAFYLLPTIGSALIFSGLVLTNFVIEKIIIRCSSEVVRSAAKNIEKLIIVNTREQLERGVMRNHFFRYMAYGKGLFIRGESMLYRIVAAVRCAFFVLTIAMTIVSIVMLFVTIFEDGESGPAKYDPIPNHIVDTVSTKHGDDYIAYNYVKNTLGSAGDLNNYIGRSGWLMLYYTKDRAAGEPITDDFRVVKGNSNPPLDYEGISIFGSTNAANVTSEEYTGVKDPTGGTYIYFSRGNSYASGSAISGGYLAIVIGLGVCGGILIGTISSRISSKKKKALA